MIYRHTEEEIEYYFSVPALNQSSIKVILKDGIQKFAEQEDELIRQEDLYYEEKQHFIVGSAVDHIITQGMESFQNKYAYSTLASKPPDTVMSIVKKVFDTIKENRPNPVRPNEVVIDEDILAYKKELYDSCNEHLYYMNRKIPSDKLVKGRIDERTWEDDKRVEGFLGDGTVAKYWQELIASQGKQLLSEFEKEKILSVSNSLLGHKHTAGLLKDGNGVDVIFQMPLFFTYNDVVCKALPDEIRVDHNRKVILIPDIKTLGDYVLRFSLFMRMRRYDIQGSYYLKAVKENLHTISKLIGKDITNYSISNPGFIVESTVRPGTPMVYVMTDDLVDLGIKGDGKYLLGYTHGVELYKEWSKIEYSLDERFKSTNGMVWVDSNFSYNEIF